MGVVFRPEPEQFAKFGKERFGRLSVFVHGAELFDDISELTPAVGKYGYKYGSIVTANILVIYLA